MESLKNYKRKKKRLLEERSFRIPSRIKHIREASKKIERALRPLKLDKSFLFDVRLCVEEAVRNAIVHGNRSRESLAVNITYRMNKKGLEIEVQDMGKGFDFQKVPDPTAGDNILKPGGRGVFLIKHLMDEVNYNKLGNRIRMIKFMPGGEYGAKAR